MVGYINLLMILAIAGVGQGFSPPTSSSSACRAFTHNHKNDGRFFSLHKTNARCTARRNGVRRQHETGAQTRRSARTSSRLYATAEGSGRSSSTSGSSSAATMSPGDFFMGLFGGVSKAGSSTKAMAAEKLEAKLLTAIGSVQGRGRGITQEQRDAVDMAVEDLEAIGGVADAASSLLVDGSWRLIFTTTPGTASPVQRSFVGVDNFSIYQDIDLFSETAPPTVTNVVDFGPKIGQLRVTALASTAAKPMEGFVPRRGDGKFFGLNILGVSETTPAKDPNARIDFQFDEAAFDLKALPFNIPYPVPFRWLGDEVKGWIDVTYLSERLRIARGNKGTLFILQRPDSISPSSRPE